jgi:hypothetical protein
MGKTKAHSTPPNGNRRSWQRSTNDLGPASPVGLSDADASSSEYPRTPDYLAQISDLRVSAERIRHFAELDLGELVDLPSRREDLVALSIRMDAAFTSLLDSTVQLIDKDYEDISREALEAIAQELALDFIEQYGTLAFYSSDVKWALWSAQRLKSAAGPKFLRQVGQRLAVFVAAQNDSQPQKSVGIAFTLGKPQFLAELKQLSRDLGTSQSDHPKADQLLELVRTGSYERLKQNLRLLEEFLRCDKTNLYLHAKNETAAERLAQYGARGLTSEKGEPITPDWFFYTWVAWWVNKKPGTVRRLIQTAEARVRSKIAGYEKTYKR